MFNDLRYTIRTLLKSPGFTAIAIVTLAIGIGANTAIFSVVNGVLLRPLPFNDPGRIIQVWTSTKDEARGSYSAGDFLDVQRENRSLTAIAGYRNGLFTVTANQRDPEQLEGSYVTVDFFDVLGVPAALGRTFTRTQDGIGGEARIVLSHRAWEQLFGSSPDAIGVRVKVDGEWHTVTGVMPARAEWPSDARLWILSSTDVPPSPVDISGGGAERDIRYFETIARLKPEVSLAQAADDLRRVNEATQQAHPATSAGRDIKLGPIHERIVGDVRPALLVLQAAVALVLLIACANVSSLLIARSTGRRREIAIRAALGARRGRLMRQLLTESLALGVAGGVTGLLVASWMIGLLLHIVPERVPRVEEISIDWVVASITFATALGTGVLFGVLPAIQASRSDASSALKDSGERTSAARARGRAMLVVAEIALTLVLLTGAALLANSFVRLQRVDSGLRPDHVNVMSLAIPQARYPKAAAQTELYRRLIEGLSERPEVQAVGVGFPGPLRGSNASGAFFVEGIDSSTREDKPFANIGSVSGGYFAAMGVPILAGRTFTEADREDAPPVVIVSAALGRKYWPGESPLGKRVRFDSDDKWMTVVGVAGDVRQLGLEQAPPPILYLPYKLFALPFTNLAVRSAAPDAAVADLMRAQIRAVDPEMPTGEMATLHTILDRSIDEPRFRTLLLGAFAMTALLLAAVGVYGLISYSVTQRTREIGIRIALGARPGQVVGPMIREGIVLAVGGLTVGLAGAFLGARALSRFLFGVGTSDPVTFVGVSILLFVVALVASYIPSRRAMRVDPIVALRSE
jgi:putative ABC transport system permease protein